jgi:hypothetical protein
MPEPSCDQPAVAVKWPPQDPDDIQGLVDLVGAEGAAMLLGIAMRQTNDAPRLRQKVEEVEANPDHPEANCLWSYRQQLRSAESCRSAQQRFELAVSRRRTTGTNGVVRPTPRSRGAGRPAVRGASRRSSARSGDSGDDDPGEPPPSGEPTGRRFCVGCGRSIDHLRSDARSCGAKCRQRRHRHVDPLNQSLDADPYLSLSPCDRDWLQRRVIVGCRCNGSHVLDAGDGTCLKCGRERRSEVAPYYVSLWRRQDGTRSVISARSAERDHHRPLEEVIV